MGVVARYGTGGHMVWFEFYDDESPIVSKVIIKAESRAGIAAILRKYHKAKLAVIKSKREDYPKYGYRYLARKDATARIFTTTKDGLPLVKIYDFFHGKAGFLGLVQNTIARLNYGYRQIRRGRENGY